MGSILHENYPSAFNDRDVFVDAANGVSGREESNMEVVKETPLDNERNYKRLSFLLSFFTMNLHHFNKIMSWNVKGAANIDFYHFCK